MWGIMRASPEYELRSTALKDQRDAFNRQQGLAEQQWGAQQQQLKLRNEGAEKGASSLSQLVNEYNLAYGEARGANERRYQGMLDIADQTTGQRQADIRQDYMGQQSDMMQQLARLGMGNTTIGANLGMGIQRGMQESLNRSSDTAQQTRLGIMERRTDAYPENDMILALAQQLGQSSLSGIGGIMKGLGKMTMGSGQGGPGPVGPNPPGPGGLRPVGPNPPG